MVQPSAASVRPRWLLRCSGGRMSSTARLTLSGAKCWTIISQKQNRMKTSPEQTSQSGATRLQFSQEDSLASPSVMPASAEARKMTATSGRSCCGALSKSDPVGLLAKMLLESPRWHSPVRMLRWESKPICSERVTRSMRSTSDTSSTKSARVLSEQDIPSSRCLFRLVPWELRTEGAGCSSLRTEMLPTPRTCSAMGASLETERMINHEAPNLETIVARKLSRGELNDLLPTPLAVEVEHKQRVTDLLASGATDFHSRANGEIRPNGLMDYLRFKGILPTPQASQEKDSTKDLLPEQNQHWLLTPSATDGLRGEMSCNSLMRHKNKTEEELAKASLATQVASFVKKKIDNGSYQKTDGDAFRLSPLFTEEMMGFPFLWTTLPFLSENGSEKA